MRTLLSLLLFASVACAQFTPPPALVSSKKRVAGGGGGGTALVTSTPTGSTRDDLTGAVGFKFITDSDGMTVSDLGMWIVSGNSASHTVRLINAGGLVASASVSTSGEPSGYKYVSITPVGLTGSTTYILSVEFTSGAGDVWYDGHAITTTSEAGSIESVFATASLDAFGSYGAVAAGQSYVPPNLKH